MVRKTEISVLLALAVCTTVVFAAALGTRREKRHEHQALSQLRALSKDSRLAGAMSQALLVQLGALLGAEQQNVGVSNGAGTMGQMLMAQHNVGQTLTAQQTHHLGATYLPVMRGPSSRTVRGALSGYHGE